MWPCRAQRAKISGFLRLPGWLRREPRESCIFLIDNIIIISAAASGGINRECIYRNAKCKEMLPIAILAVAAFMHQ